LLLAACLFAQDPDRPASQPAEILARPVSEKEARDALARLQGKPKGEKPTLAQRVEQIDALAAMQHKTLVRPLADLVRSEKATTARKAAAHALMNQASGDAHASVIALLGEDSVKDAPLIACVLVDGLAKQGYVSADWEPIEKLFERDFAPERAKLQISILKLAAKQKEKQAIKLLVAHLDEPIPSDVDGAANPPADYWEKRWKAWHGWHGEVSEALFAVTGQRFSTSKEAKVWLRANGKRLGLTSG
jgi:hypothetical protein